MNRKAPHKLHKHLLSLNAREHFWQSGNTIVVGVSGGGDSMCLLHALASLREKENLTLIVAHVNYGLRAKDADRDERHVVKIAENLGLPCEIERSHLTGKASEERLRDIRHCFFVQVAKEHNAQKIALAHTINDHAETFLLRLFRGSGIEGLANMGFVDNMIIRPLLGTTADEARKYCRDVGLRYFNDYTNHSSIYTRNRIRHRTIPHLAKNYNPQIIRTLSETAHRMNSVSNTHRKMLEIAFSYTLSETGLSFALDDYQKSPPEIRPDALHLACTRLLPYDADISYRAIRDIDHTLMRAKNKSQKMTCGNLILHRKNATVKITLQR